MKWTKEEWEKKKAENAGKICANWIQGFCRRGRDCTFEHEDPDQVIYHGGKYARLAAKRQQERDEWENKQKPTKGKDVQQIMQTKTTVNGHEFMTAPTDQKGQKVEVKSAQEKKNEELQGQIKQAKELEQLLRQQVAAERKKTAAKEKEINEYEGRLGKVRYKQYVKNRVDRYVTLANGKRKNIFDITLDEFSKYSDLDQDAADDVYTKYRRETTGPESIPDQSDDEKKDICTLPSITEK